MKVIRNSDNQLLKARIVDEVLFADAGKFQVKELTKGAKWVDANISDYRQIKAKTLKCTGLDHSNAMKKSFKVGKRYQVESGRALGGVAGYIFDNDGYRWTLFREEVGFSIADGTTFEAKYI